MTVLAEQIPPLTGSERAPLDGCLDIVLDAALALNRVVGAVVVVAQSGDIVYQRAVGFANRETRKPMRLNTIFRFASLAKPVVSAAALALVEQTKLGLNDPVTKWIPDFRPTLLDGRAPTITIRQLLTHTAGLSYGYAEAEDGPYHQAKVSDGLDQPGLSGEENLRRLASAPLLSEPGTSFQYSLAIDVLGEVLARVKEAPLPQVIEDLVTEPLRMRDTGFAVERIERLAVPYVDASPAPVRMPDSYIVPFPPGAGVSFTPGRILDPNSYPSGGAGMAGTAPDFVVFLEALRAGGEPILEKETVKMMTTNQIGDFLIDPESPGWGFGFGAAVLTDPIAAQTPQAVGTFRWGGIYGHSWFVDPESELTVVALTNTTLEGMAGVFPLAIRDAVYRAVSS